MHILSGDLWGGAEAQTLLLCINQDEFDENYVSSVLIFNEGFVERKFRSAGVETFVVPEGKGFLLLLLKSCRIIKSQNNLQKIDLMIAHGYKESIVAFILSRFSGVPWILQVHGMTELYSGIKKLKSSIYKFTQFSLAKLSAKRIIFVSRNLKNALGFNTCKKSLVILNAALTPNNTRDTPILKEENPNLNNIKFIWIGRMVDVKRPDLLLSGFKLLHDDPSVSARFQYSLTLAGDGPLLSSIKDFSKSVNTENINFTGFVSDTSYLYNNQPVLVLTSDSEGIPTIILEACHAKCPIITRKVGGIEEIFEILYEYPVRFLNTDSPEELKNALIEFSSSIGSLRKRAEASDTSYFLPGRLRSQHYQIYKSIIFDEENPNLSN